MNLDVHGVCVALVGDDEALGALRVHFFAFECPTIAGKPDVTLELRRGRPVNEVPRRLRAHQVVERGVVYNDGPTTWVDHHGLATSRFDFSAGEGCVVSESLPALVEHGYLMARSSEPIDTSLP